MMTLHAPLTDAEYGELEDFLLSEDLPEGHMDIAMLDGFFTALAIGPNTLVPSQWLPVVWGETAEEPMQFESAEQMRRIVDLVMRMYNGCMQSLQEGIDEFEPLIYQREHEGRTIPIIDEWCMGFMQGVQLDPEGWQPLIEAGEEDAAALLAPMLLYGTEAGWDRLKNDPELEARHQQIAEIIGPCVIGIRDYWLPRRKAAATFRREAPKVGRNDPCPCGSGKKYKKCCGSAERLH